MPFSKNHTKLDEPKHRIVPIERDRYQTLPQHRQSIPDYPPPSFQEATAASPTSPLQPPTNTRARDPQSSSESYNAPRLPPLLTPLQTSNLSPSVAEPSSAVSTTSSSFSFTRSLRSPLSPTTIARKFIHTKLRNVSSEPLNSWEVVQSPSRMDSERLNLLDDRPPIITPTLPPTSPHHLTPYPSTLQGSPRMEKQRIFDHAAPEWQVAPPSSPLVGNETESTCNSTINSRSLPSSYTFTPVSEDSESPRHYLGRPLPPLPAANQNRPSIENVASSTSEGPSTVPYTEGSTSNPAYSEFTDLDALVSQIESSRNGSDYESLLMLSQFLGPADAGHKKSLAASNFITGQVKVVRRRILRDGRVKLKLTLVGRAIDKCGVCLSQFKATETGACIILCEHCFHRTCLERWLSDSLTCPVCRISLRESTPES